MFIFLQGYISMSLVKGMGEAFKFKLTCNLNWDYKSLCKIGSMMWFAKVTFTMTIWAVTLNHGVYDINLLRNGRPFNLWIELGSKLVSY